MTTATISCKSVSPVLPVRNVRAALDRYATLGFEAKAYAETGPHGPIYGFLSWGPVELHLALTPNLDPKTTTAACYLYVSDATALHAKWKALPVEGRLTDPQDTPYGLREFAYIDPDGNLLRIGSNLASS